MILTASFAQTPGEDAVAIGGSGRSRWRLERVQIVRRQVYNKANDKVGEISDVIIESNGKGTLILKAGDFRGIVRRYVLVSMDSLKFVNKSDKTSAGQTSETRMVSRSRGNEGHQRSKLDQARRQKLRAIQPRRSRNSYPAERGYCSTRLKRP